MKAPVDVTTLITFDLDHTLWDPDDALRRGEQASHAWLTQAVPAFGERFPVDAFVALRMQLREQQIQDLHHVSALRKQAFHAALQQCGVTADQAQALALQAFEVFWRCRQQVRVFEETPALLQQLSAHYTLGALSNGNACLKTIGLMPHFAFHFAAENFPAPKPAPDLFLAALQHTNTLAASSVHIGDHPIDDMQGARDVGMKTVWVNLDNKPWPTHLPRPDAEVHHLRDIPSAVHPLSGR